MTRLVVMGVALLVVFAVAVVGPLVPVQAAGSLSVEIDKKARLLDGGQAVEVTVTVQCPPDGGALLESLVYIAQDEQTSQFSGIPVVCDGQAHTRQVIVRPVDTTPFHRGKARASAYVLWYTPDGTDTVSAGDTQVIHIKKR